MQRAYHPLPQEAQLTIAACYLSPEGLVFGADSTTTYTLSGGPFLPGQERHYNYGQKIFEIGSNGTLGIVTWGLGGLRVGSYRTLIAKLGDDLTATPPASVLEAAQRWAKQFWICYSADLAQEISTLSTLATKQPFSPMKPMGDAGTRNVQEEVQFLSLRNQLVVGFCLGGYITGNRDPFAYQIVFDPLGGEPVPDPVPPAQSFWGVPALIGRLINGCADEVMASILASGKWAGTPEELDGLVKRHKLVHPATVPIREAIDFTHACLLTTIKAMKFSNLPRTCGGPIELAVITTDRQFRWVKHKTWEAAIKEGEHGLHATLVH